jgi:hypothetical protein
LPRLPKVFIALIQFLGKAAPTHALPLAEWNSIMASAPANNLPVFYNDLLPLSSVDHASYRSRTVESAPFLTKQHAVPLTVDEFVAAQRFVPIIFSAGDEAVPLALMGLNEGVNTFLDDEGSCVPTPTNSRSASIPPARRSASSRKASRCSKMGSPAN